MTDAMAHAILTFAMTSSAVQGTGKGNANGAATSRPSAVPKRSSSAADGGLNCGAQMSGPRTPG